MRTIARQDVREAVFGWALYLTAALGVLVAVVLVYNSVLSVAESGLEIVTSPFTGPLLVALSLAALYLAGWATLAIARPRDQGALRVLFFAPIDPIGLLGAHLLAALLIYVLTVAMIVPLLAALAWLTNLPFPLSLLPGVVVSIVFVAPAVAIGLFISAIAPSTRSAVFLFALALAFVLAVQVGYSALLQIPPTSRYYDALLFLRELVRTVRDALQWVSPLALLSAGLDAAARANWPELLRLAASGLVGTVVWLTLAAWAMGRRGVLP
jgi:hypothetical protein